MGVRGRGEPASLGQGEAALGHRREHVAVGTGVDHDRGRAVVLGRGPDHRGAADVDLLHAVAVGGARGHGLLERVEVDHHQLEGVDLQLFELLDVGGVAAVGQQAGMHARVQGLDAAVETLGEPGQRFDGSDGDAVRSDLRGGAAGGDDLHTGGVEPAGQLFQPTLVIHRDQRAPDGDAGHFVLLLFGSGVIRGARLICRVVRSERFCRSRSSPHGPSGRRSPRADSARRS